MVAETGLEPAASGLWARRATNCSTPRYGAGDRGRTGTGLLPWDFKSQASANSATPASLALRSLKCLITIPRTPPICQALFSNFSKKFLAYSPPPCIEWSGWAFSIRKGKKFPCATPATTPQTNANPSPLLSRPSRSAAPFPQRPTNGGRKSRTWTISFSAGRPRPPPSATAEGASSGLPAFFRGKSGFSLYFGCFFPKLRI